VFTSVGSHDAAGVSVRLFDAAEAPFALTALT